MDSIIITPETSIYNVEKQSITENNTALRLNNYTVSCYGGNIDGWAALTFENDFDFINLNFDHCFASIPGLGTSIRGSASISINDKTIWHTFAGNSNTNCDSMRHIELCQIPVSSEVDSIKLRFNSNLVVNANGSPYCSSWVIDNVEISSDKVSNISELTTNKKNYIIQNPVNDKIRFITKQTNWQYKIYDSNANLIDFGLAYDEIAVDTCLPGIYFLQLQKGRIQELVKFIKI